MARPTPLCVCVCKVGVSAKRMREGGGEHQGGRTGELFMGWANSSTQNPERKATTREGGGHAASER